MLMRRAGRCSKVDARPGLRLATRPLAAVRRCEQMLHQTLIEICAPRKRRDNPSAKDLTRSLVLSEEVLAKNANPTGDGMSTFKNGDTVVFRAGPRSTTDTTAKVTGQDGAFLVTKDATGKERKIRAGSCRKG